MYPFRTPKYLKPDHLESYKKIKTILGIISKGVSHDNIGNVDFNYDPTFLKKILEYYDFGQSRFKSDFNELKKEFKKRKRNLMLNRNCLH